MVSVKWSWSGALFLAACAFESTPVSPAGTTPGAGTSGSDTSGTTDAPSGNATSNTAGEEGEGTTSQPVTTTPPPTGETGETGSPTTTGETGEVAEACPQPLPESWVLCEDFEDVGDLSSRFAEVSGSGVAIGGPGYNNADALEITHFAQQNWVGRLLIRFGQGPAANNVAEPTVRYDEVWVRLRFRAGEGWPGGGPGEFISIDGVQENPGWGSTFRARIDADQDEFSLWTSAFTCIFGDQHVCTGTDDWNNLDYLGGQAGDVPVFTESVANDWHCAVVHARLNTAGNSDGVLEARVDGQPNATLTGLNYRGARTDLGFNVVAFPTYTDTPTQNDHRRYVDDVVVSTEALDCE